MTIRKKSDTENVIRTLPGKYFQIYFVVLFPLIAGGCRSLPSSFYPNQQTEYSNNPQLQAFKDEMNPEDAIRVLRTYIKDDPKNTPIRDARTNNILIIPDTETTLPNGEVISKEHIQENTVVNEELISYELVKEHYKVIEVEHELMELGIVVTKTHCEFLYSKRVPHVIKYEDIKNIKLFQSNVMFNQVYTVYLYDESNNASFYFTQPGKNKGKQKVYELLAALSILIPHAKEEYNENEARSYKGPISDLKL